MVTVITTDGAVHQYRTLKQVFDAHLYEDIVVIHVGDDVRG